MSSLPTNLFGLGLEYNKSKFDPDNAIDTNTLNILLVVMLLFVVLGFSAVNNLVPGTDERSNNIKLLLYVLLILSGGQISLFYIIMWIMKIKLN
jgi:hypothetical protein